MEKKFPDLIPALFILGTTLAVYLKTLLPTVQFSDVGELQTVAATLGIAHPSGYPLYTLLGKLFTLIPIKSPAWRVNFMSAFFASLTAVLVYLIIRKATSQRLGGLFAAFSLAFSKNFWRWALAAEMYSLNVFLVALLLYLLLVWQEEKGKKRTNLLYLFSFLYGLSWGNHTGIIALAPTFGLFILLNRIRFKAYLPMLAFFGLGLSIYLYLPIRARMNPPLNYANPANFTNFTKLVLAKQFRSQMFSASWPEFDRRLKDLFQGFVFEFSFFCFLPFLGIIPALKKKGLTIFLVSVFLITTLVWLKYNVSDYERYISPLFFVFFSLAGLGISHLQKKLRPRPLFILLIFASAFLPLKLYQENYDLVDQSKNFSAYQWGIETLAKVEPDGVVLSWWPYSTVLWYLKYGEGLREDVMIIDDQNIVSENLGSHEAVMRKYVGQRPFYILPEGDRVEKAKRNYQVTFLDHLVRVELKDQFLQEQRSGEFKSRKNFVD